MIRNFNHLPKVVGIFMRVTKYHVFIQPLFLCSKILTTFFSDRKCFVGQFQNLLLYIYNGYIHYILSIFFCSFFENFQQRRRKNERRRRKEEDSDKEERMLRFSMKFFWYGRNVRNVKLQLGNPGVTRVSRMLP